MITKIISERGDNLLSRRRLYDLWVKMGDNTLDTCFQYKIVDENNV